MRLGVYTDLVYRSDDSGLSADLAFVLFVAALAPRVHELVLFGRLDPRPGRNPHPVPAGVRFVPLPHYPSVRSVGRVVASARGARRVFAAELEPLDAVWLFGPHPLALEFARLARQRGKRVFLGVRQEFVPYVTHRLPSRRWLWAVPAARALELAFRRLARTAPTVAVGEAVAARYRRSGGRVLATGFSLVPSSALVQADEALARPWDGDLQLFTVARLDPEKNPLLLPEILAGLRARERRWRLKVVGDGPLREAVARRAAELGVADALDLLGYVPVGEALWAEYRSSHAFVHVSLTEGLPQVLFEAQAAGLPVVATDVGGVAAALENGAAGLLVPPADSAAAVGAVERLRLDPELRRRLVAAGLKRAATQTMDAQLDEIVRFFRQNL